LLGRGAVIVLIMLTAGVVRGQDGGSGPPAMDVRVARLELRQLQDHRRVTGDLRAVRRARVATLEPGLVNELPIQEGQAVEVGDVLAVLDNRRLALQLARLDAQKGVAQATLAARQAEARLEASDLATIETLRAQGASNPKELADAEVELTIAEARVEAATRDVDVLTAQIELAQTRLDDTTITAPFPGVVVAKRTELGQWVAEGEAIAEVVAVGAFDAWLDVPQMLAEPIQQPGAQVRVQLDATGRMSPPAAPRIVPLVDPTGRTFRIVVPVEDPRGVLKPGMSVTGWVPTGQLDEYLTVPRDALLRNEVGFYVYVARTGPGGATAAVPVQVTVAFEVDSAAAVRSGPLAAGDLVVVEGNERLYPMAPIAFEPPVADRSAAVAPDSRPRSTGSAIDGGR
jgi:RND family efflux transporter MFP subunit